MRKRWLTEVLFARRSVPRDVAAFIARQLLTMPEPLRTGLSIAPGRVTLAEVTRQDAGQWLEICDTAPASRLPLLMLAPIAVTYEYAMTENLGRATWRTDHTYSPCPRAEAGRYLIFLAGLGYQLSRSSKPSPTVSPTPATSPTTSSPVRTAKVPTARSPAPPGQSGKRSATSGHGTGQAAA